MKATEIINNLINNNTGGYFYLDNCKVNYSSISGWYCKDFENGKMKTYNITRQEAENKIASA